ncbi:MAG: prepilin-type N-terminal cleavage/methylation domain-containing protein [Candidatus Omnitrophota bacterium]
MAKRRAFSLIEILLAFTVIAVFFGLIFAFYKNAINKSKYVEAVATVSNIAKTEEIAKLETGEYIAAENTQEVNERLGMNIEPRWFNYKVIGVTNDNFIVLAERIRDDIESGDIAGDDIVVARDSSGPIAPETVNQPPPPELGGDTGDSAPPDSSPGGGPSGGSPGGGTPGGTGGDDTTNPTGGGSDESQYNNNANDLLSLLNDSTVGHDYYDELINNGVDVQFADLLSMGALGLFVPEWWFDVFPETGEGLNGFSPNTIYLDNSYMTDYAPEVGAAVLMHEATHAYWDNNIPELADYEVDYYNDNISPAPAYDIDETDLYWTTYQEGPLDGTPYINPDGGPQLFDTVIQEYSCFVNEVLIWNEFSAGDGSLSDPDGQDVTAALYDSGDLFAYVYVLYNGYALYDVPVVY